MNRIVSEGKEERKKDRDMQKCSVEERKKCGKRET